MVDFILGGRRCRSLLGAAAPLTMLLLLPGCAMMTSAGPTTGRIANSDDAQLAGAGIKIIDVNDAVARQVVASERSSTFAEILGDATAAGGTVGPGDVLDIAIWEAPPAALFGAAIGGTGELGQSSNQTARGTTLPEQMVPSDGFISIPFAGKVRAAGRTSQQISQDITKQLMGIAHSPQVVVRVTRNMTRNVTVVGDVNTSARVPLTAKGERLLDIIAAAGGVKQPVNKTMIQITRGNRVVSQPLEGVVSDPRQNIRLQADDVVTAYFQRYSFTALGATGNNSEIPFEGTGITLSQALGRIGGLNDLRADASGVFIFRLEDPGALNAAAGQSLRQTPDGKVPVIYRINLHDPANFFVAQGFPIKDKDVLYVSNAKLADLQKFVNIVSSVVIPAITVQNSTR